MEYKKISFNFLLIYILFFHLFEGMSNVLFSIGTYFLAIPLLVCWLYETVKINKLKVYKVGYLGGIYCFFLLATCIWSSYIDYSINYFIRFISVFILYIMIGDLVQSFDRFYKLIYTYVIGIIPIGITALLNLFSGTSYNNLMGRYSADGFDPNNFGIILNITVALSFILLLKGKMRKLFCIPIIFISIFLIFSTGSRASVFVFLLCLIALIGYLLLKKPKILMLCVVFSLVFFYSMVEYIPEYSINRSFSSINIQEEDRFEFVKTIVSHIDGWWFLFGHGYGSTAPTFGYNAHNTFISNLYEGGLIALYFWSIFIFYHYFIVFKYFLKTKDLNLTLLLLALIALFIGLNTLNWEFRKDLYIILSISLVYCKLIKNDIYKKHI